jgi:crotonobetainyl-CoA:carnitine CoA-transferase CaiB-like acyl-CoA transferase
MDLTIQAMSGLIAATGFPDGPPVKAGPAVVDFISGIHLYAATLTALFERERTDRGRLVEVAMQEAAYATLTSQLHAYFETGQAPPRTGNASHGRVPLNVYPTSDGYVAMNIAVEEHWYNLLRAMGREDLRDDLRFADTAARVTNREATDALVAAWTRTLGKMEVFAIAKRHRIPLAPVREVDEVMRDRHMHERGMLEWIEHDELGGIVVPTTPLRIHGADPVDTVPSPKLGQHNREIYGDWLGLSGRRDRRARARRHHLSQPDNRASRSCSSSAAMVRAGAVMRDWRASDSEHRRSRNLWLQSGGADDRPPDRSSARCGRIWAAERPGESRIWLRCQLLA